MNHNPLYIAEKAQQMAKHAGDGNNLVFQKVAMVSMVVMAAASASQILVQLLREINRKDQARCR